MNNYKSKKKRVIVAMSGGVDSSTAASLLCEEGYDVIGITLMVWECEEENKNFPDEKACCSLSALRNAQKVCEQLKISHYTINLKKEFETEIIEYFIREYLSGRTPNPCVRCNPYIKWKYLLKRAHDLNAEYIATGHYATVSHNETTSRFELRKGIDNTKDQSYALWALTQNDLKRTVLPLGSWTKAEIRTYAGKKKLKTAHVSESQDICFIRDNDYKGFLLDRIPELKEKLKEGKIIGRDGTILGTHDGYPFYTIGQRKRLGISLGKPAYIYKIDPAENEIYIGTKEDIAGSGMIVDQINLIPFNKLEKSLEVTTKIRYKDPGKKSLISPFRKNKISVEFLEPIHSITPGQSAVFYQNDLVIGGGIIEKPL